MTESAETDEESKFSLWGLLQKVHAKYNLLRVLYRQTRIDGPLTSALIPWLKEHGSLVTSWGDSFEAHRVLSEQSLPTLNFRSTAGRGQLYLVRGWPYILTYEYDLRAPDSHMLYSLIGGPTQREIMTRALEHANKQERRFKLIRVGSPEYGDSEDAMEEVEVPARGSWFIPSPEAIRLQGEVEHWMGGQSWYHERGLAWRLGVMLYGPPGTGKTSLIRKLAQDLEVPLFTIEASALGKMSDWSGFWKAASSHAVRAPAFILIEDFDLALRKDIDIDENGKPVSTNSSRTLSSLMNLMDGITTPDGIVFFVTTNNPENIEPEEEIEEGGIRKRVAILRPGRIDLRIHMGEMGSEDRLALAQRILRGLPEEQIAELVGTNQHATAAEFRETCRALAVATHLASKSS